MNSIRMLIVEDDRPLLETLKSLYRQAFLDLEFASVTIETAETVSEARELARQAGSNPYDLVSLDVALDDRQLTGLDVLAGLKRFRSAWMVALLTSVETQDGLDERVGLDKAEELRQDLRPDAYARFPAERLLVVEKPAATLPAAQAAELLANRIGQIALMYREIGRLRYVFRPIEVVSEQRVKAPRGKEAVKRKFVEATSLHWQIRFDCGDLRTLPDRAGFRTLHYLLSMDRADSLTVEHALAIEPKVEKEDQPKPAQVDPLARYFEAQGVPWGTKTQEEQDNLIKAALSLRIKRYVELREYQEDNDIAPEEEEELDRIVRELGPLADAAEDAYQRLKPNADHEVTRAELAQEDLHPAASTFSRRPGGTGYDSPEAERFRQRMKRTRDYLRENGFADLATHLEAYLMSTSANWSYNPPAGIEWTTS